MSALTLQAPVHHLDLLAGQQAIGEQGRVHGRGRRFRAHLLRRGLSVAAPSLPLMAADATAWVIYLSVPHTAAGWRNFGQLIKTNGSFRDIVISLASTCVTRRARVALICQLPSLLRVVDLSRALTWLSPRVVPACRALAHVHELHPVPAVRSISRCVADEQDPAVDGQRPAHILFQQHARHQVRASTTAAC